MAFPKKKKKGEPKMPKKIGAEMVDTGGAMEQPGPKKLGSGKRGQLAGGKMPFPAKPKGGKKKKK